MVSFSVIRCLTHRLFLITLLILTSACSNIDYRSIQKTESYAVSGKNSSLAIAYQAQKKQHLGKSGFVLVGDGLDGMAAKLELFEQAEQTIDVQYYLIRDDLAGNLFYHALMRAADRGVRVRLLLDDQYLMDKAENAKLASFALHPYIQVRVFNPYNRKIPRLAQYIFKLGKATRRMHNKSAIVDNQIALTGSRNIGNEYGDAKAKYHYSGMDVLTIGLITKQISQAFDRYWNDQRVVPISYLGKPNATNLRRALSRYDQSKEATFYRHRMSKSKLGQQIADKQIPFRWAPITLLYDSPEKIDQAANHNDYLDANDVGRFIQKTQKELFIVSPYFIPGKSGIRYFKQLSQRGVNITILTNSYASTNVEAVNAHYNKYRQQLLKMGITLYEFEYRKDSIPLLKKNIRRLEHPTQTVLHAKLFTFDDQKLYVGSLNVDPRSINENTELGLVIDSAEMTRFVKNWFYENMNQFAYKLVLHKKNRTTIIWQDLDNPRLLKSEPDTNLKQKVWMSFLAALPFENQL